MDYSDGISDKYLQKHGCLLKKSLSRWSKRFFVLKDGFLFQYNENERREFEKRPFFNCHPKAALPMGHSKVLQVGESGQPFSFLIRSDNPDTVSPSKNDTVLAAESEYSMESWIDVMKQSALITWSNFQLTDQLIRGFESCGLQLAADKQNYQAKLQVESLALLDEKMKSEELQQVKQRLQEERDKMKELTLNLKNDYDKIKTALDETSDIMCSLENDNKSLISATCCLQNKLECLEEEKDSTISALKTREQLMEVKKSETENLKMNLKRIEDEKLIMEHEKLEMTKMLADNEFQKRELIVESSQISHNARQLERQISEQKSITDQELKDEILARLEAEKRLMKAESALRRIETNLTNRVDLNLLTSKSLKISKKGTVSDGVYPIATSRSQEDELTSRHHLQQIKDDAEILVDVKSLKNFFEKFVKSDGQPPDLISCELQVKKNNLRRFQNDKLVESIRQKKSRSTCYENLKSIFETPLVVAAK